MTYLGDVVASATVVFKFTTVTSSGAPATLGNSPGLTVYPAQSTVGVTAGVSLATDFDGITGLNQGVIDCGAATNYATAQDYAVVITTGTVSGISLIGYVVASFSIKNRPLTGAHASAVADIQSGLALSTQVDALEAAVATQVAQATALASVANAVATQVALATALASLAAVVALSTQVDALEAAVATQVAQATALASLAAVAALDSTVAKSTQVDALESSVSNLVGGVTVSGTVAASVGAVSVSAITVNVTASTVIGAVTVSGTVAASVGAVSVSAITVGVTVTAIGASAITAITSGIATASNVSDAALGVVVTAISTSTLAATNLAQSTKGIVYGTVGAGSASTGIVTSALSVSASVTNQFQGAIVTFLADTTTVGLRGCKTDITASTVSATPTLTVTALPAVPASGDKFAIT